MSPRHLNYIVDSGVLRVGYYKSPDIAYAFSGQYYGYEYQILNQFAKQNKLKIKLIPISPKNVNHALSLGRIDIAMGGFIKQSVDPRFFQASHPFESQTVTVVEKRKNNIAASTKITSPVYFGRRLHNLPTKQFSITSIDVLESELSLFQKLSNGDSDISLVGTTFERLRISRRFYPNIRNVFTLTDLQVETVWLFGKRTSASLIKKIDDFLKQKKTTAIIQKLKKAISQQPNELHYLDTLKLNEHIKNRLPEFQRWFRQASLEHSIDWVTLAAMAYQESKWKTDAVSPTKVRGIMQMTTKTATTLGIKNRLDPYSTIFGAAKYVKNLEKRMPKTVSEENRFLMAIGAYNIGFGNIMKAYRMASEGNDQTITWKDIAKQLPKLKINNLAEPITQDETNPPIYEEQTYTRGVQAVNYVARVEEFSDILRYHAAD